MNNSLQKFLENFVPFLIIGVAIALMIGFLTMFFYIAIWGLIIGAVLWAIYFVKEYFFPTHSDKNPKGRIIEHDNRK